MCTVSELNKRSRALGNTMDQSDICCEVSGILEGMSEKIADYGKKRSRVSGYKEELARLIAANQMALLMLCEAFGISDREVCEAGCELFDEMDKEKQING